MELKPIELKQQLKIQNISSFSHLIDNKCSFKIISSLICVEFIYNPLIYKFIANSNRNIC